MSGLELALFDLDGTLLDGDTDVEWAELLADMGLVERARIHAFLADYRAGRLDVAAFYAFQLGTLARHPRERLLAWRARCLAERLLPRVHPRARGLIDAHARAGRTLALVTATNRFLVEPLAAELGFVHVLATEPELRAGRFTGAFVPPACYGQGKLAHVDRWLAGLGRSWGDVRASWFHSDSHNDLPLLERVDHPVAVAPDPLLRAVAGARGWPVLD